MFFRWLCRGKSHLGLTIICICSLFCSYSLWACSIAPTASEGGVEPALPTVEDFTREADIIATGTVIAEEVDNGAVVVQVQYYLKGSGPHNIRIANFIDACGYLVSHKGAKEIFFANGNPAMTMKRVSPMDEWWGRQQFEANDQESINKILSMTGQALTKPSSAKTYWLWGTGGMLLALVVFPFLWKKRLKRIRSDKSEDELSN